jgi:hypothetical protein
MNNPTLTAGYSATETDDLMPVWLAQANAFDSPTDMRAIAATIESLTTELRASPERVDFSRVTRYRPSPEHMVALLRTSFASRHQIAGWASLRDFAREYLAVQGIPARAMSGLN